MKNAEIRCRNNGETIKCEIGSTLNDIFFQLNLSMPLPPVAAKVNNEMMSMNYRIFTNKTVEFIDITNPLGLKIYTRTLFFILCKAVHDLFPNGKVRIEFPVSNGYYCLLKIGRDVTPDDVHALRQQMDAIIASATPIRRHHRPSEEVIELFRKEGDEAKVELLETQGRLYTTYCSIDDYNDSFYGPTLCNTQEITNYGLEMYYDGLLLRIPQRNDPTKLGQFIRQDKMFDLFEEYHQWQDTMRISTVGRLNKAIMAGYSNKMIMVFEALQEKLCKKCIISAADLLDSRQEIIDLAQKAIDDYRDAAQEYLDKIVKGVTTRNAALEGRLRIHRACSIKNHERVPWQFFRNQGKRTLQLG